MQIVSASSCRDLSPPLGTFECTCHDRQSRRAGTCFQTSAEYTMQFVRNKPQAPVPVTMHMPSLHTLEHLLKKPRPTNEQQGTMQSPPQHLAPAPQEPTALIMSCRARSWRRHISLSVSPARISCSYQLLAINGNMTRANRGQQQHFAAVWARRHGSGCRARHQAPAVNGSTSRVSWARRHGSGCRARRRGQRHQQSGPARACRPLLAPRPL
jgi:hypothetical protein